MHINELPNEILNKIFEEAAASNTRDGVSFTFGLSQAPLPLQQAKLSRYVRGPVSSDDLRWDATKSIRQVCTQWHDWALAYSMKDLHIRRWRGSERWAEITRNRSAYSIYELIESHTGTAVYRDPFSSLAWSDEMFSRFPTLAAHVRRLWFNGFYSPYTDGMILSVLRSCRYLTSISVPWTLLRHGTADQWIHLLGIAEGDMPVESLELQAVCLSEKQMKGYSGASGSAPLLDSGVDFSRLKRLKLFGNTDFMPITDDDLFAIARTATNLEELHLTNISTVSIAGVIAIVKASQNTIRVLEHSPRSDEGFSHPHPGTLQPGEHVCEILTACPNLRDLSISVPSVCSRLFENEDVKWAGELQIRATTLCPYHDDDTWRKQPQAQKSAALHHTLQAARSLVAARRRQRRSLDVEVFFGDCIFDPQDRRVHGDFATAEIFSNGHWSGTEVASGKGPYGSTGLYGKDEGTWTLVSEDNFMRAVERGWFRL